MNFLGITWKQQAFPKQLKACFHSLSQESLQSHETLKRNFSNRLQLDVISRI